MKVPDGQSEEKRNQVKMARLPAITGAKRWILLVGIGLVLTTIIIVTAAIHPENASSQPADATKHAVLPQTLHVNLRSYPQTLDPQKSSPGSDISHLKLVYEGLTRLDANLETVPGAAEKWEYNADATELTFTLRANLKYSDGSLLNAKRFEYSILRNIDPATGSSTASLLDDIIGAQEWRSADLSTASTEQLAALTAAVKVEALDQKGKPCTGYDQKDCRILKIGLKHPASYFHTLMSLWIAYPARQESIEIGGNNWWTFPQMQIGNGPMVLFSLEPNSKGLFTPNTNYWRGKAQVSIEVRYLNDSAAALAAYKNGTFDIIPLDAGNLAALGQDSSLNLEKKIYPGNCTDALMFNPLKEPFTDQKIREAFSYGFDRDAYINEVLKGLGIPTHSWIPQGFAGSDPEGNRLGFDATMAQEILAASSYASVENLPGIVATYLDTPRNRTRWEWIAAKYTEVLGVYMTLNPVNAATYTSLAKDPNTAPQMFWLSYCSDVPDPNDWFSVFRSTGAISKLTGYSDPELDALLTKADSTTDPAKRLSLYEEAQKRLVDAVPGVFINNNINAFLVKPHVKGIQTTPMDSGWPGEIDPLAISIE